MKTFASQRSDRNEHTQCGQSPQSQTEAVSVKLLGSWPGPGDCYSAKVKAVGNHAYLVNVGNTDGLYVLDVSNPAQPKLVGRFRSEGWMLDFEVISTPTGTYACVIDSVGTFPAFLSRLLLLDLSDPTNPKQVGRLDLPGRFYTVLTVVGNYAYVGGRTTVPPAAFITSRLEVIDIGDPARLLRVGTYDTVDRGMEILSIKVAGSYAYLTYQVWTDRPSETGSSGMLIIDVSNPGNMRRLGRYRLSFGYPTVEVAGKYAYLRPPPVPMTGESLQVIAVSDPAKPTRVSSYPLAVAEVQAVGDYAYVSANAGLVILNVSNPAEPKLAARHPGTTSGGAGGLQVVGNKIFRVASSCRVEIFEITLPEPLRINAPVRTGDKLNFSWNGVVGIKLQATPSLTAPNWQDVPGTDGASSVELPLTDPSAFFRLVKPQAK